MQRTMEHEMGIFDYMGVYGECGFSKISATCTGAGVPLTRIMVYWAPVFGETILSNFEKPKQKLPCSFLLSLYNPYRTPL